jgi:hypothetical protein
VKKQYEGITHNEQYESLQIKYLETRHNKILGEMYLIAKEAASSYIRNYCNQRGLRNLDIDELSHSAAIFVIEQYLKKPEFKVEKISAYIYFGVQKSLFRNKDIEIWEVSYDELTEKKEHKDK